MQVKRQGKKVWHGARNAVVQRVQRGVWRAGKGKGRQGHGYNLFQAQMSSPKKKGMVESCSPSVSVPLL